MAPVYAAKYSNVPVWVSNVKNVSVMRRQGDGWVNATHLLKVADFDKPRRTRILERDVQTGEHEKVQGGYGKYQGTWIPVARAIELSKQVGILDIVQELLLYAPQEGEETEELPRQPKAVGVSRKQSKTDSSGSGTNGSGESKSKRARKTNSVPQANSVAMAPRAQAMQSMPAMNGNFAPMQWSQFSPQASFSPQQQQQMQAQHGQHQNLQMTPQQVHQQMQMSQMSQMPVVPLQGYPMSMNNHQQFYMPDNANGAHGAHGSSGGPNGGGGGGGGGGGAPGPLVQTSQDAFKTESQDHSRVSSPSLSSSVLSSGSDGFSDDERPYLGGGGTSFRSSAHANGNNAEPVVAAMRSSGVAGPSEYQQQASTLQGPSQYMAEYSSKLLDFFMSPDKSIIPATLLHPQPGPHINQPIDDEGNTAFHWTCAIGKIELMQALLDAGADPKALNHAGQTPLVRAVMFTNNYEARTFPRVLSMLVHTASLVDPGDRTILHHVARSGSSSSRSSGARYYTEILLAQLSSSPELIPTGFSAWLNHQDQRGDTALHLACRNDSRRVARVLLSYHASPLIPNKAGTTAEELLRKSKHKSEPESKPVVPGKDSAPSSSAAKLAARETLESITNYLNEIAKTYETDLANKDSDIHQVRQLLDQVRQRVSETEQSINRLQDEIESEEKITMETEKLEKDTREKAEALQQLLERSQARDLALMVQKQETDIQDELKNQISSEGFDESEQVQLSQHLNEMQRRRQSLMGEIVLLYSNAGSLEKIGKYRKLLALCCEVPETEVDGLLDGITHALGTQGA